MGTGWPVWQPRPRFEAATAVRLGPRDRWVPCPPAETGAQSDVEDMVTDPGKKAVKSSRSKEVEDRLARHGGLTYLEIPAVEPRRSAAFYEHVLDWTTEERADNDIRFRDPGGDLIGRWVKERDVHARPGLLPYCYVDDIDNAVRRAVTWGGEIIEGPRPEGNLRVAHVRDPAGNVIGLWQAPEG
jgi:predicted enzyme related to lactoylglutathione lyase